MSLFGFSWRHNQPVETDTVESAVDLPPTVPKNIKVRSPGIYGLDDDETPVSFQKLYNIYKSDSTTFNEVNEVAYIASRDFKITSKEWDAEENEGVTAVRDWMAEYKMYPKIQRYIEELVRDRRYGLSAGELVDITNPLINGGNPILYDLVTISPHTIEMRLMERDKLGNLTKFVQSSYTGLTEWKGDECDAIQLIRWNENSYSKMGMSHIVPSYTDINNFKDLRLFILEIFKKDARPIVEHTLDSEGLSTKQVKNYFSEYQTMLNTTRAKKLSEVFKTEKWSTEIKGFQGKTLDYSTIVNKLDIQRREALRFPNMASGEGTNKATMEVQRAQFNQTKISTIDRIIKREIIEPMFDRVLNQLGLLDAPRPTIKPDPIASLDKLTEAQADAYYAEMLGPEYAVLVAEKVGIRNYDKDWKMNQARETAQFTQPSDTEDNNLGKDGFDKGKQQRTSKGGDSDA